jgi:hypothetical protein
LGWLCEKSKKFLKVLVVWFRKDDIILEELRIKLDKILSSDRDYQIRIKSLVMKFMRSIPNESQRQAARAESMVGQRGGISQIFSSFSNTNNGYGFIPSTHKLIGKSFECASKSSEIPALSRVFSELSFFTTRAARTQSPFFW